MTTIAEVRRMALRVAKLRGKSKLDHALVLADMMDEAGIRADFLATGRTRGETWILYSLDAWGNAEDGFEVNDVRRVGSVRLPAHEVLQGPRALRAFQSGGVHGSRVQSAGRYLTQFWRLDPIAGLQREGYLKRVPRARFEVHDEGDGFIEVDDARTGEPLFQLRQR